VCCAVLCIYTLRWVDPSVQGVLTKCLKGFLVSEVNSESGQATASNPRNVKRKELQAVSLFYTLIHMNNNTLGLQFLWVHEHFQRSAVTDPMR